MLLTWLPPTIVEVPIFQMDVGAFAIFESFGVVAAENDMMGLHLGNQLEDVLLL